MKLSTNMIRPRFCAELVMVVVVAASLVDPPSIWVLAAPLAVIVTPATQNVPPSPADRPLYKLVFPAIAIAGVVACITLAVWAIFSHNSQVGLFVAFAVFGTATLPEHFECVLPPRLTEQLKLGTAALHATVAEKKTT